jgi:hypothetical protein
MNEFSDHTFQPLGCQKRQGPIIYCLCTGLPRAIMKENALFSFIWTGPAVLIALDNALVGVRPGLCGSDGAFSVGRADASRAACRGSPPQRTWLPWPWCAMLRRDPSRGLLTPQRASARMSGVHLLPWSCHASLITASPPEPHRWTRLACVLRVLPLTGGTGPARTHGPSSTCTKVGLWPSYGCERHDDMSERRFWQGQG